MREFKLNRRDFIKGAVSVPIAAAVDHEAIANQHYDFLPSELTVEQLEQQKSRAIKSLSASIPDDPKVAYLHDDATNLNEESQMYIPSDQEIRELVSVSQHELELLAASIQKESFGLFLFFDADDRGRRRQRLYVFKRLPNGSRIQNVKAYKQSGALGGFGNEIDSNKSPLGFHRVHSGKQGMFGEVVSAKNKFKEYFNHVKISDSDHWFVKGFGSRAGKNDIAEVVTDQYLLTGQNTPIIRGIRIHGTNRSGERDKNGRWRSFLDGRARGSGCFRLSNTDVRDLALCGFIWTPHSPPANEKWGTPVMVHATKNAIAHADTLSEEEIRSRPKRWPVSNKNPDEQVKRPESVPTPPRKRPPHWKPEMER